MEPFSASDLDCSPRSPPMCLPQFSKQGSAPTLGWARLVAPYRAILRYYHRDTPYRAILFKGCKQAHKMVRSPHPLALSLHRHICAIPHFATYRAIIVRYRIKTSTQEFCDTITTSIARYESIAAGPLSGRGVCETESKKGCSRHRKSFIHRVDSALRGIETMVSDHGLGRGRTMG